MKCNTKLEVCYLCIAALSGPTRNHQYIAVWEQNINIVNIFLESQSSISGFEIDCQGGFTWYKSFGSNQSYNSLFCAIRLQDYDVFLCEMIYLYTARFIKLFSKLSETRFTFLESKLKLLLHYSVFLLKSNIHRIWHTDVGHCSV